MNTYSSLRKQNNESMIGVVALILCVVVSGTFLFNRLVNYSSLDEQHYIPLTTANGITNIIEGYLDENGEIVISSQEVAAEVSQKASDIRALKNYPEFFTLSIPNQRIQLLKAEHGFQVTDENTVWMGQTDVEIFKISYENGESEITVNSSRGDKVIAPGTNNVYNFTLENTGNVSLDYELSMEAYFSDGEHKIPVDARVYDYEDNYLAGSAEGFADVLELNNVKQTGTLSAGRVAPYTLEWQWPFEEDDEYDTMLGNLAVDEDISLTIVIKTVAVCDEDHTTNSGEIKTGDTTNIALMSVLLVGSLAGLLILLLIPRFRRDEEETHEKA